MAPNIIPIFLFIFFLLKLIAAQEPQTISLPSIESESIYRVLESINPDSPWRTDYPDDLCFAGPHGIICDYFEENGTQTLHITELNLGNVSDHSDNPHCTPRSVLSPLIFSFIHLRKLFVYHCFISNHSVYVPLIPYSFGSSLEQLVVIENPSLVGNINGIIRNFPLLKRVIVTGNGFYGSLRNNMFLDCVDLKEITVARNHLSGEIPRNLWNLKNLRVLDLSGNRFVGKIPDSIGDLSVLSKLDLSYNELSGKIPESLRHLRRIEFLDLSFNRFSNSGVPLFLQEMWSLKELFLSGNNLGGMIPEIWGNLSGIQYLGFSKAGLVGSIPPSMGLFLKNLCYFGLDNNQLDGEIPQELGFLESLQEMNLENNKFSGRLPFSSDFIYRIGNNLRLGGNPEVCVDEDLSGKNSLRDMKFCGKPNLPKAAVLHYSGVSSIKKSASWIFVVLVFMFTIP